MEPRGIGAPFRQLLPTAPLREFATYFGVHQKTIRDGTLMIHGPTKSRRMRRVPLPERLVLELRNRIGRLVPFMETHCGCFARKVRPAERCDCGGSPHSIRQLQERGPLAQVVEHLPFKIIRFKPSPLE